MVLHFGKSLTALYKRLKLALPRTSHTRIVHCVAQIQSLVNLTIQRSNRLLLAAKRCPSVSVSAIYILAVITDFLYLYWL